VGGRVRGECPTDVANPPVLKFTNAPGTAGRPSISLDGSLRWDRDYSVVAATLLPLVTRIVDKVSPY